MVNGFRGPVPAPTSPLPSTKRKGDKRMACRPWGRLIGGLRKPGKLRPGIVAEEADDFRPTPGRRRDAALPAPDCILSPAHLLVRAALSPTELRPPLAQVVRKGYKDFWQAATRGVRFKPQVAKGAQNPPARTARRGVPRQVEVPCVDPVSWGRESRGCFFLEIRR